MQKVERPVHPVEDHQEFMAGHRAASEEFLHLPSPQTWVTVMPYARNGKCCSFVRRPAYLVQPPSQRLEGYVALFKPFLVGRQQDMRNLHDIIWSNKKQESRLNEVE
eukprot:scaffold179878_cov29-Prasinocladus_malaysianus.AAC.1